MMYKRIELGSYLDSGEPVLQPVARYGELVKTASLDALTKDTLTFISNIPKSRDKVYTLCVGLGNSEFWGSNVNGEWFTPDSLMHDGPDYGFRTFTALPAHFFRQHANKDPNLAMGPVEYSLYNPHMQRVDLIFRADRDRAERFSAMDLYNRLEAGEPIPVSMGCRVPFDVCSECGHQAKRVVDYCTCLKNKILHISPDGRQVCAINTKPRFFDISEVGYGADRIAWTLDKVAAVRDKTSTITKRVEAVALPNTMDPAALRAMVQMSGGALLRLLRTSQVMGAPFYPKEFVHLCQLRPAEGLMLRVRPNVLNDAKVLQNRELLARLAAMSRERKPIVLAELTKKSGVGLPDGGPLVHTIEELGPFRAAYAVYVDTAMHNTVDGLF